MMFVLYFDSIYQLALKHIATDLRTLQNCGAEAETGQLKWNICQAAGLIKKKNIYI